jgi:hypothetical protein
MNDDLLSKFLYENYVSPWSWWESWWTESPNRFEEGLEMALDALSSHGIHSSIVATLKYVRDHAPPSEYPTMLFNAESDIRSAFYGRLERSRLHYLHYPDPNWEGRFKEVDLIKTLFYKDDGTPIPGLPSGSMKRAWSTVHLEWIDPENEIGRLVSALNAYENDVARYECVFLDDNEDYIDLKMVEEIEVHY